MLQQSLIPQTPDEVAASLSRMTEAEQCIIKGAIFGLTEARRKIPAPPPGAGERPSA